MFRLCFLFILTISARPIISTSAGLIFAKVSGLVKMVAVDDQAEIRFWSLSGCCHDNQLLLAVSEHLCSVGIRQMALAYDKTTNSLDHSCPWVGLTHRLGWVRLGRDFSVFGGSSRVGSTIAKVLNILNYYLRAFEARLDKICLHQAVKFDFTTNLTGTGNRSQGVIM